MKRNLFKNLNAKQVTSAALVLLMMMATLTAFIAIVPERVGAAPVDDYTYCKVLPITNANNSLVMMMNLSNDTVAGRKGAVNCSGNINANFSELTFYDIDNTTKLNFWVENISDGSHAWLWVKLPGDIETDGKIMMYYGDATKTISESNGTNTFYYFDDFSSDNMGSWGNDSSGTARIYAPKNISALYYGGNGGVRLRLAENISSIVRTAGTEYITKLGFSYDIDSDYVANIRDPETKIGNGAAADLYSFSIFNRNSSIAYKLTKEAEEYYKETTTYDYRVMRNASFLEAYHFVNSPSANFSMKNDTIMPQESDLMTEFRFSFLHQGDPYTFEVKNSKLFCSVDGVEGNYSKAYDWWWVDNWSMAPPNATCDAELGGAENTATTHATPGPANNSYDINSGTIQLNITVADPEGSATMNTTIESNSTGAWVILQTITNHENNTYQVNETNMTANGTKYWWTVNTTDGSLWTNSTFHLTTTNNTAPTIENPNPIHGAIDQALDFTWNVTIQDNETLFNWLMDLEDTQWAGLNNASNGSKTFTLTGLDYNRNYTLWVNVTDRDATPSVTSKIYYFVTKANTAPAVGTPSPVTDATDQELNPNVGITISDANGHTMNVTFMTNTSGSWQTISSNTSVTNGTYENITTQFHNCSTKYWWRTSVTDGYDWVNITWNFTTRANHPPYQGTPLPADEAIGIDKPPETLSIIVYDNDSDLLNITMWENATNPDGWTMFHSVGLYEPNTVTPPDANITWINTESTTYWWAVNVSDGNASQNVTYSFNTSVNTSGDDDGSEGGGAPAIPPDDGNETTPEEKPFSIPGFEMLLVMGAIMLVAVIIKRRRIV